MTGLRPASSGSAGDGLLSRLGIVVVLGLSAGTGGAAEVDVSSALIAKHTALAARLNDSPFKRPLVLDSVENGNRTSGEIYAVVDHPFVTVDAALDGPSHWCEVLILHVNTKYCHARATPAGTTLTVNVGRKDDQPLADTYRADFAYRVALATPTYFAVRLSADTGPLNTSDYRIDLEGVALDSRRTFLHLTYAYSYGFSGRLAMQAYLATGGRGKVGFTTTGARPDGEPAYIGGVRGVIERNTMRYYFAVVAYLDALASPPQNQVEKRLQTWFDATEQYPQQLHEVERATYLAMKRRQVLLQQSGG